MATNRNVVFADGEIYHVYNRGVERRPVFTKKREHQRAVDTLAYYRFASLPMRYSQLLSLPPLAQETVWQRIRKNPIFEVHILAYCLMPNHFHLMVKQTQERGISRFMANVSNSYTKYFNTKYRRVGSLFQGPFKAVYVETEDQLLHLTRYVHLNPVASMLVALGELDAYPWSSFAEYMGNSSTQFCDTTWLRAHFSTPEKYRAFVHDQADYAQKLECIKHIAIDEE
ncbi:MAG: transposase [Patescibacteria group bacterium]